MNIKNHIAKVIIVGDSSIGKTSLVNKYIHYNDPHYVFGVDEPTIGVDMKIKYFDDKNNMKMYLWDTTGLERFRSIVTSYFRNATGVFICYDVSSMVSFHNVNKWIDDVNLYCDNPNIIKILIATKSDISELKREVSFDEGQIYAFKHNMLFFETSSKLGINIKECFDAMAEKIYLNANLHSSNFSLLSSSTKINVYDNKKKHSSNDDKIKANNCLQYCSIL